MLKFLLLFVLICLGLSTIVPHVPPIHSHVPRVYKVHLEDDLLTRWKPIAEDYKEAVTQFMKWFDMLPIPKTFFEGV